MKIWTLTISHRHGRDTSAHLTAEEANAALADYAREWWEHERISSAGDPPPNDDAEAVACYFERMGDETADIDESDLALPPRVAACVAACEGISTEALADGVINDALACAELLCDAEDLSEAARAGEEALTKWRGYVHAPDGPAPFRIQSLDSPSLYWSNADGWGDHASATTFTAEERARLNLPVGGAWVEG